MLRVVRVYLQEAGVPAAVRAAPLYFGVLIVATVLFAGPNAMRAADAVRALAESRPLRLLFWTAWIAGATPAARILFQTPSTYYLRTLPRTGAAIAVALGVGLVAVEAPWIALFARGAGPVAGLGAAVVAAALHASVVAPVPLAAVVLVATILWPLPEAAFLLFGLAVAIVAVRAAYRRAPERAARPRRNLVRGPAPIAIALALVASGFRSTPAAVTRGLLVALAGAALVALVAHNNDAEGSLALALGMTGPVLVVAVGGIVESLAASEREMGWMFVTTQAGGGTLRLGRAAAVGGVGAGLGLVVAAVLVGFAGAGVALVGAETIWGAGLAVLVASGERVASRGHEREGGVAVTWAIFVAIGAAAAAGYLDGTAVALLIPAALLGAIFI